jgi:hypothetical protein
MLLQLSKVVEGIGAGQFTGVDQTHEQITGFGAVQRAIKQRVLAMQYRTFQRTFANIMPIPGLCRADRIRPVPCCFRMMANAA